MDQLKKRRDDAANMWETTSLSGVKVHPMRAAVQAMINQGRNMDTALAFLPHAEKCYKEGDQDKLLVWIARINKEIHLALEEDNDGGPTSFSDMVALLPQPPKAIPGTITDLEYLDRVKGGWVGKCIGTALGDPVEGWTSEMIRSRYGTVTDYLVPPKVENDDTAYPILVLHALDEYGPSFTSEQLALEWVEHLPYAFTAEQTALDNIRAGIMPPESGRFHNPCSEWIGAQMRGEIHGFLTPFRPDLAIEFAFRDAIISHRREGIYGEVFCSALISIAFSGQPIEETLRLALAFVPPESRFREVVERTMRWCNELGEWEGVLAKIEQELGHYHWIHTFPNIATVVTGLLLGERDFEKSLTTTLMCGFDTDCSAGQVGGLLGTILGYERIPDKWKNPVGEEFESYVIGFEKMSFAKLSEWTAQWGKKIVGPIIQNT